MPRGAQGGVGDDGHEGAVEAVFLRQAGEASVGHPLRDDERGDAGASGEVPQQELADFVRAEPVETGQDRGEVVEGLVGVLDAAEAAVLVDSERGRGGGRRGKKREEKGRMSEAAAAEFSVTEKEK